MEGVQAILISDLLRRRRPISGATTLSPSHPPVTPSSSSSGDPKTLNPKSDTKILKSLSLPSMIVGFISLPKLNHSLSSTNTFPHLCFSFSDNSASICCDLLHFDIRIINRKIYVLAWNFIPFKQSGGLLEILNWQFHDSSISGNLVSFPLSSSVNNDVEIDNKAKYSVYGLLLSVSPVSYVPSSNDTDSTNLSCFILEFLLCDCKLCKPNDNLGLGRAMHGFSRSKYVYFGGIFLSWYPALVKLIGTVLSLSGLRKKLVYTGKEETRLMFVSTEMTRLCFPNSRHEDDFRLRNEKVEIKGKGELGKYIGVVRGIYMQGMVVQLDEEVWLLLTDGSLLLPHSVRIGSILSLRNVHIVNSKFPWGKMLILGACCKTNISTISFSPLETGCQPMFRSQSLLGKFVESLVIPARLWVLLLVQCLRKKFSGVFSEKEILGTKHKEGLVQSYASFILPSSVFQSQRGVFTEFCKHDLCGSIGNFCYGSLNLALPFSNLVKNCERIFIKSLLQMNYGLKILEGCSQVGQPLREKKLYDQPIRRIFPSKDIGVSLLGNLKICPATGRLQLIDATGSIDAVIPDIPSAWNADNIYEVFEYSLVLEGRPEAWGQLRMPDGNFFTCGSLFETIAIERQTELTVYVHFSWSNVRCRNFAPCPNLVDHSEKLDPGTFHFLSLAHKFPWQPKYHGHLLISNKSRLFAEFMLLPWDLNIASTDGSVLQKKMPLGYLDKGCQNGIASKKCRTHQASSCIDKVRFCSTSEESGEKLCEQPSHLSSLPHKTRSSNNTSAASHVQVPCRVTGREMHGQSMDVPGLLCFTDGTGDMLCSRGARTILLEFNSANIFKYKLLQIGGSYIVKHCAEKCFCDSHHMNMRSSISITSETKFWSLSFHLSETSDCMSGPCNNISSASPSISENLSRFCLQNELMLNPCSSSAEYGTSSDVVLHVAADATVFLDMYMGFQALKKPIMNLALRSSDIYSVGQQVGHGSTVVGLYGNQGMYSENSLPEGDLLSLQGTVISLHHFSSCSIDRIPCNAAARNFHLPRVNKEKAGLLSVRLLTDDHLVQICGRLSKLDCPVGLGAGAVVTFHRILASSGKNCLILTPVSFITVNSVREIPSPTVKSLSLVPDEAIASCLISDLIHSDVCRPSSFRCSIVSVYFVMLERNRNVDKLLPHMHSGKPVVNIPLAGFILDDGSSRCCCWTNDERAATFLRLHEEIPQPGCGSSWWRLKAAVRGRALSTSGYALIRTLKKHRRVSVKNYGSIHETLCQDLDISVGSDYTFGSQDENLLKFIMLKACSSTFWNVIGHVMDSDAVNMLEKNLLKEQMTMHALQNVWAREVYQVNPLAQSKALFQHL